MSGASGSGDNPIALEIDDDDKPAPSPLSRAYMQAQRLHGSSEMSAAQREQAGLCLSAMLVGVGKSQLTLSLTERQLDGREPVVIIGQDDSPTDKPHSAAKVKQYPLHVLSAQSTYMCVVRRLAHRPRPALLTVAVPLHQDRDAHAGRAQDDAAPH